MGVTPTGEPASHLWTAGCARPPASPRVPASVQSDMTDEPGTHDTEEAHVDGVAILETEVRELIRRRGIDPVRDRPGVVSLVSDVIADYDERSVVGAVPPLADAVAAHKAVVDAVAGLGPLQKYLDDPEVEEVWINSPRRTSLQIRAVEARRSPLRVRKYTRVHPYCGFSLPLQCRT